MRKILSFLMMTLFSVSMFAADPAAAGTTLFSEDFSSYAKDAVPSGTVTTATGRVVYGNANVTYTCTNGGTNTKIYNENTGGGTAPEILVSKSQGKFAVAGIPSGGAKAITVSFTQNKQALTVEPTGTGYTGSISGKPDAVGTRTFDITVADGADATFTLTFTGSGSSNVRVDDILVTVKTAGEAGGEDPEPEPRTLYCKVAQSWWKADGAAVGIYAYKGGEQNAAWPGVRMTLAENESDVWTATIDAKYDTVIFVRVKGSGDIIDWGAKTANLALADAGENDLYTVTSSEPVWGNPGVTGTWSKYSPSAHPKYFLKNNWDGADTWTWKEMTYYEDEDGAYYYLTQVVFGGTGVNLNTTDSETGSKWIEAKDIITYDLSLEPATLGALDTVQFIFDPQAVSQYERENGLFATILGKYVAPAPQPVLADGFYLIGKIGGVAGWAITDLKAEQMFAQNQENPGELMLNVTLAEGDELKVVNVLNNEITAWFPGDDNFIVTAAYAGEKTVYFRPDGQGGEGWHRGCIYIAPNPATGISNNAVEGKAVKMIMDGQFLIIRNGKTYNVQGQQLK